MRNNTGGRLNSVVCVAAIGCLVVAMCQAAAEDKGDNWASVLTQGKAALEDELYDLAQKQFERYLDNGRANEAENGDALVLLVRALHEQGKSAEIIELLKSRRAEGQLDANDAGALVYWQALAQYELGTFDKALISLADFEKTYPGSAYLGRAERLRAWCYLRSGDIERALATFAALDKAGEESDDAAVNLLEWGKALVAAGRLEQARSVLGRLLKLSPGLRGVQDGCYWLGQVLIQRREWTDAERCLASLAANDKAEDNLRARALFSLAVVYEAQTNRNGAAAALSKGAEQARSQELKRKGELQLGRLLLDMGRMDEGIPLLKSRIAESPHDPLAEASQLALANALLDHDKNSEAIEEFQHYLESFTNTTGQARAYQGKGWGLINVGRYAEAAIAFTKAFDLFVDTKLQEECLFKVGDAYFQNSQYELAWQAYKRLLDKFPRSPFAPRALFQVGQALALAQEPAVAETNFLALTELHPEDPLAEESLLRVAEMREAQGRWLPAIEAFTKVMDVYTNGAFFADALHGRGVVRYHLFRFNQALSDFERVVHDFPISKVVEEAYFKSAMCHYWMARDEKAVAICTDFIKRFPKSRLAPDVFFWIANYEYNQKNYEAAESHFLALIEKYPGDRRAADALLWAGRAAAERNEYLCSIEHLTRLVKDYPNSKEKIVEARFSQGNALCELAEFSESILIFNEIINKYPENDLVAPAWLRKGDCQFLLGAEDPKRYEEAISSYRVVANRSNAGPGRISESEYLDLILESEYKIGRCLEKLGRTDDAIEQYYTRVMFRFMEERKRGTWLDEASKMWFTRASFNAADIMEAKEEWRKLVNILERVVSADVRAAEEAQERIRKIRADHFFLFY